MDTAITLQLTIPAGTSLLDTATKQFETARAIEEARQKIAQVGGSLVEVAAQKQRVGKRHGNAGRKLSEETKAKQRAYWARMSPAEKAARVAKAHAHRHSSNANGHAA